MIIAVDFDGTIVEHKYPLIGKELPFATTTLLKLMERQHRLILWTARRGRLLQEAVDWCKERGIEFYAINKNFPEEELSEDNCFGKINADIFIDDRNLGGLPDWGQIYRMIAEEKSWKEIYSHTAEAKPNKRKWFCKK